MLEEQPASVFSDAYSRYGVARVPARKNINSIYGEQRQNSILIEFEGEGASIVNRF